MQWTPATYDYWKTTPDEGEECPECGDAVRGDKWVGHCVNEDCDYSYDYCDHHY